MVAQASWDLHDVAVTCLLRLAMLEASVQPLRFACVKAQTVQKNSKSTHFSLQQSRTIRIRLLETAQERPPILSLTARWLTLELSCLRRSESPVQVHVKLLATHVMPELVMQAQPGNLSFRL